MRARTLIRGVLPAALLVLAACGSDDEESSGTAAPVTTDAAADTTATTTAATTDDTAAGTTDDTTGATTADNTAATTGDTATDDTATGDTTGSTAATADTTGSSGPQDGPPDVNPCAEGQSGELFPVTPPADDATELTVVAEDYSFAGLEDISVGEYALALDNQGEELHEIVIVRINDDETRTVAELLQAAEDPATFSTNVAMNFACPGDTSDATSMSIAEPGRYVAVCFIPVGAKPETVPAEFETLGPPHALQGMVAEFTVEG